MMNDGNGKSFSESLIIYRSSIIIDRIWSQEPAVRCIFFVIAN